MTGLNYTTYVSQLATMAVVPITDTNFQTILPMAINYAELRIQRDIDFLNTTTQLTFFTTPGSQQVNLSGANPYPFVTVQNFVVLNPTTGYNSSCQPVSKEYLFEVWPSGVGAATGFPKFFAMLDDNSVLLGPIPDQSYTATVTGTIRFPSLNDAGPTGSTFISTYLPDLLIMASMIYVSAYQRNFGKAVDDPQMAVTYESQYQALLKGAMMDEARKSFEAGGWTSNPPSILATPGR